LPTCRLLVTSRDRRQCTPSRGELKALGNMEAGTDNRYVAKDAVDYQLWNALIGVREAERLRASGGA